jgi:hypothetical protein
MGLHALLTAQLLIHVVVLLNASAHLLSISRMSLEMMNRGMTTTIIGLDIPSAATCMVGRLGVAAVAAAVTPML